MRVSGVAVVLTILGLTGCGYKVGGTSDLLPSTLKTIAIPAFANNTTRYKLTERLPSALALEFIARTRYRVIADPSQADAILRGAVLNVTAAPTIFDSATNRASGVQVSVFVTLRLVDRATQKELFSRTNMEIKSRYEVSTSEKDYFDESEAALERLSREFARAMVSAILEAF
jgi:hypothetical protein